VDLRPIGDIQADVRNLPFKDNVFAVAFIDPPWTGGFKIAIGSTMKELVRVARIVYVLSPWTWGSSLATMTRAWVCWQPGVFPALILARYVRNETAARAVSEDHTEAAA